MHGDGQSKGAPDQGAGAAGGVSSLTFAGIILMVLALVVVNFWITFENKQGRDEQRNASDKLTKDIEKLKADASKSLKAAEDASARRLEDEANRHRERLDSFAAKIRALEDANNLAPLAFEKRTAELIAPKADAKLVAELAAKVEAAANPGAVVDTLKEAVGKLEAAVAKAAWDSAAAQAKQQEQHAADLAALKTALEAKLAEAAAACGPGTAAKVDELAAKLDAATKRADELAAKSDAATKRAEELATQLAAAAARIEALEKAAAEKK